MTLIVFDNLLQKSQKAGLLEDFLWQPTPHQRRRALRPHNQPSNT